MTTGGSSTGFAEPTADVESEPSAGLAACAALKALVTKTDDSDVYSVLLQSAQVFLESSVWNHISRLPRRVPPANEVLRWGEVRGQ
jgi:hypothetical protein